MSGINHTHGSNRRFSFHCSALNPAILLEVASFEGEESLAGLYRFELLLVSSNTDIDERMLIGAQATFRMNDGMTGGEDACYTGIVENFEYVQQITDRAYYKAALAPRLWRLGQFYLTEVYLDKTPLEIIDLVLQGAGLNHNEYDLRIANKDKFPRRKFIFQFQETYLDFLSRYCERLGIYWWFEYQQNKETLVFGNHIRSHDSRALQLIYQTAGELDAVATDTRRVQSLNLKLQSLPQRITVMDHYYKRATQQIKGTAVVDPFGTGEVTYYGLHINTNEAAQSLAKIRAEGLICRSRLFSGESTATGLRCGGFIELSGHNRSSFNQQYLLTKVFHKGAQSGLLLDGLTVATATARTEQDFYKASFSAIPADVPFRPEIIHPWPSIEGSLTAYIDAEGSGQYAELNENGEYKVQLPYDITEKSDAKASAWIRMATPYAGDGYGMHFPLHKGTEVLLSFHNGNPDEPVILGAVYNSITANVVTNENQTQSMIRTAGGNQLTLEDRQDNQQIALYSPTAKTMLRLGDTGQGAASLHEPATTSPTASSVNAATDLYVETQVTDDLKNAEDTKTGIFLQTHGDWNSTVNNWISSAQTHTQTIYGPSTTQVHGKQTGKVWGQQMNVIWGQQTNMVGGQVSNITLGGQADINTPLHDELTLGAHNEAVLGLHFELHIGAHIEKEGIHLEDADAEIAAIHSEISTINAKVTNIEIDVMNQGAVIGELDLEIKDTQTAIEKADARLSSTSASIEQVDTRVTQMVSAVIEQSILLQSGTFITTP